MQEPIVKPRRLRSGSRVALISPAGPIDSDRLDNAVCCCDALGLVGVPGRAATARTGYLAGSDAMRAADLQNAIDDDEIDAIWALRGGYGTVRILSLVSFDRMRTSPKPYIGFSDNTSIHLALARIGVVSFHGPHAGGDFPVFSEQSFRNALFGNGDPLIPPADAPLEPWYGGVAEGRLVGGNLALLAAAEGTPYAGPFDDAILFVEDITEAPYRVDRLMMQLLLSGSLDRVAGIVVGQFTDCDDAAARATDVIREALEPLRIPVLANAPIGHVPDNWTVPIGIAARLDADAGTITLQEAAVI
jgi:muramoyltetrapeptide carboxypeptidase